MYLHIGKDIVIEENKIIGIFNIETIKSNNYYKYFYKNIKEKIIDISDDIQKTLILINDEKTVGYITNISSTTLKKR